MSLLNRWSSGPTTEKEWQSSLRLAARTTQEILSYVQVSGDSRFDRHPPKDGFSAFAPLEYLDRVRKGDRQDPLLLQVLPLIEEEEGSPSSGPGITSLDPVGDRASAVIPGLLHKYHGRMLMILTGACAIHCRYCFRQHFPYSDVPKSIEGWKPALDRIERDPSIQEILLSGGDPLMLVDDKLGWLVEQLDAIAHLKRLRIHTRLPIMIPQRVCHSMLNWLENTRLSTWMVLHINHAREIDESVHQAIQRIRQAGCQVLNQSVLLRGINDSVLALVQLSEKLLDSGVVPYYLHQLDPVQGAMHFHVDIEKGRSLVRELRKTLPGYAVPRYVSEIAGEEHKTLLL